MPDTAATDWRGIAGTPNSTARAGSMYGLVWQPGDLFLRPV
jgi:hypothetical protein